MTNNTSIVWFPVVHPENHLPTSFPFSNLRILHVVIALMISLASLSAVDAPPTIATAAAAVPTIVTGKTTNLTVVGADDGGAAALVYVWSSSGPAPVIFSSTGLNASRTVTATFGAAGDYVCTATVSDAVGQSVISSVNVHVASTMIALGLNATTAVVNPGSTKTFVATAKNQFGTVLTGEPLVWSATGAGAVDANGLFTAGATPGQATVTVTNGTKTATVAIRVNAAPSVTLAPIAIVLGTKVAVTATGTDSDDALTTLTYTWSTTGPKTVGFSANSTNAGASTTATFGVVGNYMVTVTVKDPAGLTGTASQPVVVQAVPTTALVTPNTVLTVVNPGATRAFAATVYDQFKATMTGTVVSWSLNPANAGTMSSTGLFTAVTPAQATVTASIGMVQASAPVRVNATPTVTMTPISPVTATTVSVSATGSDDDALSTLSYSWVASGPKRVLFSPNSTTASATTTATFTAAGTYLMTVAVRDRYGLTSSTSQSIVVQPVATTATLSPAAAVVLSKTATTFTAQLRDQFGAAIAGTVSSTSAIGGSATFSNNTCTFIAGTGSDPGSVSATFATNPPVTATAQIQYVACEGNGTGLAGTYFDNEDFTGTCVRRLDPQINFTTAEWIDGNAIPGIASDWWSAIWVGSIEIPRTDTYTFKTWSNNGVKVQIDGTTIIENWAAHGDTLDTGTIALTAGKHPIQIRFYNTHESACMKLRWSSSVIPEGIVPQCVLYPEVPAPVIGTGTGLSATYFDEDQFGGFSTVKVDANVNVAVDSQASPASGIAPQVWSAKWVGQIEPQYTDTYNFSAVTNHPFKLFINGQVVIDDQADGTEHTASGTVLLTAGKRYDILATYRSTNSPSRLTLSWSCALAGPSVMVPSTQLYPVNQELATSVEVLSPLAVYASPAWVEGSVGHWTTSLTATVNGTPVTVARAGAAPWYITAAGSPGQPLGVPLTGLNNTLVINSVNGGATQHIERTITWTAIDLASRPYGLDAIDIRPGDSLRLTATGAGTAVNLDLDQPAGQEFTADRTGISGQIFEVSFPQPGTHTVVARLDGAEVGRLTVHVPNVDLKGPIACHVNYQRIKDVELTGHGASVAFVSNDPSFMNVGSQTATDSGPRLTLRPLQISDVVLQARLGGNGPVIVQCPIDMFTLRTSAEKAISVVGVLPNGNQILQANLVMSPLIPNLDIKLSVYTGGITFEDSSLEKWISSNEFTKKNGDEQCLYRIIRTPGSAACHNMCVYQTGIQVSHQ